MSDLVQYIKSLENPVIFDKKDKFIYFPINKNMQRSFTRSILKDRVIICKNRQAKKQWGEKSKKLSAESLKKAFKFGVVRNPYEKYISAYDYLSKQGSLKKWSNKDINWFTENIFGKVYDDPHFQKQVPQLYYKDNIMVDYIIRMEGDVRQQLAELGKKIGSPLKYAHRNKSKKASKLSKKSKEILFDYYKEDFLKLGYDPDL